MFYVPFFLKIRSRKCEISGRPFNCWFNPPSPSFDVPKIATKGQLRKWLYVGFLFAFLEILQNFLVGHFG
jgi:hypothetical protein